MDQLTKWQKIVDDLGNTTLSETDKAIFNYYQGALKDIKKQAQVYIKQYETLTFAQRLEADRLLGVGEKIKTILDKTNDQVTKAITSGTAEQVTNGYYGTLYGLEGAENVNLPMSILDKSYIEQVVNQPIDGKTLSKRLYSNTQKLAKTTTQSILQGAIDGKGYAYVAKRIADQTEADYKRALRIARTEGGRASSQATQRAYEEAKDAGVDIQKTWVSTLDKKTRHSHQELDGQTVNIDEEFVSPQTGATGLGPRLMGRASEDINCRCTTITVVNGISPALRRDNETGQAIQNMNYKEWQQSKGIPDTPPKKTKAVVETPKPVKETVKRGHLNSMSETEAKSTIARELGVSESDAAEYYDNVLEYTGEDYIKLRQYQRTGKFSSSKIVNMDEYLEDYIQKAPKWDGGEIYRGVSLSDTELKQLQVGTRLSQGGTSSWSSDKDLAKYFSTHATDDIRTNKIVYVLDNPNNATSISHISLFANEQELLLSKKSEQVITKIRKQLGTTYIHLSEGG